MILCDTGPLVAAAIMTDPNHYASVELFTGLRLAGRRLLVPATVVAEVGYLLNREGGVRPEADFLRAVAQRDFELVQLAEADAARMAELVEKYDDLPLGTTDASVIALAERLGITEIATLDRRHFSVVRPQHVDALTLLLERL
ncbi:MAG: PIN domain-containing protein [Propionicimonas sp.]|nr:PIN domain-containing protein [Propionicimonas sp.]MEA5118729.1 PIN domain-containing protein [Propionicimonas sp.]